MLVTVNKNDKFFSGESSMWDTSFLSTVIMWFLNGIIVAVVLAKLFIYGEPVTHKNSEASVAYWRHRNQAEQDSSRVGFLHVT